MRKPPDDDFEYQIKKGARDFIYPRTPDLAAKVTRRLKDLKNDPEPRRSAARWGRFPLAVVTVFLAITGLVSSQVQYGRVFDQAEVTPAPAPAASVIAVPIPENVKLSGPRTYQVDPEGMSLRDLYTLAGAKAGENQPGSVGPAIASVSNDYLSASWQLSVKEASRQAGLNLPGYPQALGSPDRIFVTESVRPLVTMIWVNRNNPQMARYRLLVTVQLSQLPDSPVEGLKVHGYPATWSEDGIYPLRYNDQGQVGNIEQRLIGGHVLEWSDGVLSYRLEGRFSQNEAVKAAESLYEHATSKHVRLSLSSTQEPD